MSEGKKRQVIAPVPTQKTSKVIPGNSYRLRCLIEGEAPIFKVTAPGDYDSYDLKELIHEKGIGAERAILAKDLKLLKVNMDIKSYDEDSLNKLAIKPTDNGVEVLNDLERVSYYWSDGPPIDDRLHVFVKLPDFDTRPAKLRRLHPPRPDSPFNGSLVSARKNTVSLLYQRLNKYGFVHVRGTPASGKTTLAKLLRRHIYEQADDIRVFIIHQWEKPAGGHESYLKSLGWVETEKTVFIFDNAESTYSDIELWLGLFKSCESHGRTHTILFTSFGSPGARVELRTNTPIILKSEQRVSLMPVLQDDDDLEPVGLFLTQDEFVDLIDKRYPRSEHYFEPSFLNEVFKFTLGHVGAVLDFMSIIAAHNSYRSLRRNYGQQYTWGLFLEKVGPHELLDRLEKSATIFTRGLPADSALQDLATACVFSAVLCQNVVTKSDFTSEDALQRCFHNGWLHAEKLDSINVGYVFATPLHRWFVEWKLFDHARKVSLEGINILDFAINVIRKFSHGALSAERKIGPGCIQRPPEAQYQDEFYRCCSGSVITFPEYGTTKGRVDFYIPAKEWGVELVRDGDRLAQHSGRFSESGVYQTTLSVSDYIILDFRSKIRPRDKHPRFSNLYHIVFNDDLRKVSILDNMLGAVCEDFLLLA